MAKHLLFVQNLFITAVGALGFWSIGYALAFGKKDGVRNPVIGTANFFLTDFHDEWDFWMIQVCNHMGT